MPQDWVAKTVHLGPLVGDKKCWCWSLLPFQGQDAVALWLLHLAFLSAQSHHHQPLWSLSCDMGIGNQNFQRQVDLNIVVSTIIHIHIYNLHQRSIFFLFFTVSKEVFPTHETLEIPRCWESGRNLGGWPNRATWLRNVSFSTSSVSMVSFCCMPVDWGLEKDAKDAKLFLKKE